MIKKQEKNIDFSFIENIYKKNNIIAFTGVSGSEIAFITSKILKEFDHPVIIIVSTLKEAKKFIEELHFFSGEYKFPVEVFPTYNIFPFRFLVYNKDTAARRINILYRMIINEDLSVIVTTIEALSQKLLPKNEISDFVELVIEGEEIDRDDLVPKLVTGGYTRSIIVEEPGEFCIRGGLIDIYSPMHPNPFRIEFFGDTVESIRYFSPFDQKKIKNIKEAVILPAMEIIVKKDRIDKIVSRLRKQTSKQELNKTRVRQIINSLKEEGIFPGTDNILPFVYNELTTFFDYAPDNALFIFADYQNIKNVADEAESRIQQNFDETVNKERICADPDDLYIKWTELKSLVSSRNQLYFKLLPLSNSKEPDHSVFQYEISVTDNTGISADLKNYYDKDHLLLPLINWVNCYKEKNFNVIIVISSQTQIERVISLLSPYGIEPAFLKEFPEKFRNKGAVYICFGQISTGFVWPEQSLALITEDEIFGRKKRTRKSSKKTGQIKPVVFENLKEEDIIVHSEHGLGKYKGLIKIKLNGYTNDYLHILYKDDDKLYLPVDRMDMVQKYVGVDGFTPVLDKMGGKSWIRAKDKARKAVEKIAGYLLKLYAERKVQKGHSFSKSDRYFHDFEASFEYQETSDQVKAINDVIYDMEKQTPMDRLICGDVGYGKTEVALRAAFKAVNDCKQVAVLVPTTVLAEQHYKTFKERFKKYSVQVECLSRFRTPKKQREIINGLKESKVDIVIGTHRLLQKDVSFKDLGLLVVDEEQRFGVKHKEKFKEMKTDVDILTLSATPIPRTLHMSMMGIRDISVISTPPEHRQAIESYILEYDDTIISEAMKKELDRDGQIFFVHNNINSIYNIEKHLKKLLPEIRTDVAHGRLSEKELEKVMFRFINREIDMLVCTTIIESGLDIPSANTMLINRADKFGLAQMYQLRGRVGRGDDQAYAYLFIPEENRIGKNAQKRLKVLMEYSDMGSGFQIAMSDLQKRGGGAALGASQSGHIAAVGYDMFLRLMENAISDIKGENHIEKLDPEINISFSSFIPENYISDINQRLIIYRRLAKMNCLNEIKDLKEELIDRYGPLPVEAINVFLKIMLKILSIKAGIKRLDLNSTNLSLYFSEPHQNNPNGIIDFIIKNPNRYKFNKKNVLNIKLSKGSMNNLLKQTKNILKDIDNHVNRL